MVDLTENEASANIEEPAEPVNQEENEEQFIEALIERNQNGELSTVEEVIQAILDIGGQELAQIGAPISFTCLLYTSPSPRD